MARARLAIDIGGTFTDVALETGGRLVTTKVLTTTAAPERGVLEGVHKVLAIAEVPASAVSLVIHGTTLATNAIIERRGARTALIVTSGHRDALEMAHENRFEQYDIGVDRPPPPRPAPAPAPGGGAGRPPRPRPRAAGGRIRACATPDARGRERGIRRGGAHPRLREPGPRTADRGDPRRVATGAAGHAGLRCVPRGAGVRTPVDGLRERLRAAAHGPLPARTRGFAPRVGSRVSLPPHDLRRGAHDAGDRDQRTGPSGGVRAGGGRDPGQPPRPGTGSGRRPLLRHGRDDGQAVRHRWRAAAPFADVRGRPQLPLQAGERASGADPGDRDGRDRSRGRVDRRRGRPQADPGGARERRVRAGTGGVRPGRGRAHGDGRRCRAGADRSRPLRRGLDRSRPGAGRGRGRGPRGWEAGTRPDARRTRHQRDGGREHVQRRAHTRDRVGERGGGPHADRLRGLRADPRGAAGGQAGGGPLPRPRRRGGGVGRGLPPRPHLLRGRAQPLHAAVGLRPGCGAGGVCRDASGGRGRGLARSAGGGHQREGARLHALRGPGPRDRRRPPRWGRGRGGPARSVRPRLRNRVRTDHSGTRRGGPELDARREHPRGGRRSRGNVHGVRGRVRNGTRGETGAPGAGPNCGMDPEESRPRRPSTPARGSRKGRASRARR